MGTGKQKTGLVISHPEEFALSPSGHRVDISVQGDLGLVGNGLFKDLFHILIANMLGHFNASAARCHNYAQDTHERPCTHR